MLNTENATGTVGRHTAEFHPSHRDGNDSAVMTHMHLALPVSHEDLVAALWVLVRGGLEPADLDEDAFAHRAVLDTVLSIGTFELGHMREEIAAMFPGTDDYELVRQLRRRVTALYGPAPAPRRACRSRRALVGVSA